MKHLVKCVKGFYMSLGMFCGIPLPFHIWDEKYTSHMIASFPLVGLVIGTVWWLVAVLLFALDMPIMLAAATLSLAPFLIAGFIHLDGYMDTSDAMLSWRPLEDKLRILVDPRVGAFAVIMLGIVLIFQFSAMYAVVLNGEYFALVIAISAISRCCSAFSIFCLRHMPQSNYASMLKQNIGMSHKIFVMIVAVSTIAVSFLYAGFLGLFVSAAVILGYMAAIRRVYRSFNGISGDLLGYSLVISELCGLIALAVLQGRLI